MPRFLLPPQEVEEPGKRMIAQASLGRNVFHGLNVFGPGGRVNVSYEPQIRRRPQSEFGI